MYHSAEIQSTHYTYVPPDYCSFVGQIYRLSPQCPDMGRASLWGLGFATIQGWEQNAPLLILGWRHRVGFVAEYPVSVSLVNTRIYGALNHPRGEYCQLRTFKTQIQLNTDWNPSLAKKRLRKKSLKIQIYPAWHGLIQRATGGVSLQIRSVQG